MNKQTEILAILHAIEGTAYANVQSVEALLEYGFRLSGWVAFSGEAMAEAKGLLHDARKSAYLRVEGSLTAQGKTFAVSLMKDYVNDLASKENAYYELCERCNRAATHAMDLVRTAISCLKTEMKQMNYQPSISTYQ